MADRSQQLGSAPMSDPGPFHSFDRYLDLPRVAALSLSPDGRRLVAPVQTLSTDRTRFVTALWEIDPGGGPARQLTRSPEGWQLLPGWLVLVCERMCYSVVVNLSEWADRVGVNKHTAYRWYREGRLPVPARRGSGS